MQAAMIAAALLGAWVGFGQTATALHGFEVASIKTSAPGSTGASMRFPPGGRLEVAGMTIRNLIQLAYGLRSYQLSGGPKWLDSAKYDISAKPPAGIPPSPPTSEQNQDAQKLRMQALLADRCRLKVHRESEDFPLYILSIAKTGLKMQEAKDGDGGAKGRGTILPISMLVTDLSLRLDCPVIDQTGPKGNFYVKLQWTSDDGQPHGFGVRVDATQTAAEAAPSIFTAVQEQLGLKLQSAKGPVDVLGIDHVEMPSSN